MSQARQQQGIYVHGDKVIAWPVHGGLVPVHGSSPVYPAGPAHGSANADPVVAALSAGSLAFDAANGWTTGQNPPALAITLPADGTVQVGDWYRLIYGTSSTLSGATNAPWHQITSDDVLNDSVGNTYDWGVTQLPGGLTYFGVQLGRGASAGSITLTSAVSNIISDTIVAGVTFTPSTTQPAAINNSNASAIYNFSMDFQVGVPVVYVAHPNNARTLSSVILVGAGSGGTNLTGTVEAGSYGVLVTFPAIATAGTYTVKVTLSGNDDWMGVMGGTLVGATNQHPTATAEKPLTTTSSWATTTSLAVASAAIGIAFFWYGGGGSATVSETDGAGTIVVNSGLNGLAGTAGSHGYISKEIDPATWTPGFSATAGAQGQIVAGVWS